MENVTATLTPPTLDDIRSARENVYAAMAPSPLLKHPLLDDGSDAMSG
jgi:hypothetical protein